MQILGKRSKMLLMGLLALMLITLGASFAVWDGQAALAATGNAAGYANAKVGDVIQFGRYWQKAMPTGYDDKDPIDWIVVDKDERTGQLTLLSKYILAYGSYFGTWFKNVSGKFTAAGTDSLVDSITHNPAWCESTARAFLNNLERFDLGGDQFANGAISATRIPSLVAEGKLKPSVGFSNARYTISGSDYQRPKVTDPTKRLARNGFLDEAFSPDEKQMIVPKEIPGQISHRWPTNTHDLSSAEYVPGTKDKVWLPSVEELNINVGVDLYSNPNDASTNPSERESSTPFEYFKNWQKYKPADVSIYNDFLKTTHTAFAGAAKSLGNYDIPEWVTDIGDNATNYYWTRSASSRWRNRMRLVDSAGNFNYWSTENSNYGVRPCIILKY